MPYPTYEALIIGGGPAGLAAALTLGRLRRKVLLCDTGQPRNLPSEQMHNFPGADGIAPAQWREQVRQELKKYPSIQIAKLQVEQATSCSEGFLAQLAKGQTIQTQKILLAYGMRDSLPDIQHIETLWGHSVVHCPYCHGFEFQEQALGLLADGEFALHLLALLRGLSPNLMLFSQGPSQLSRTQREQLERLQIPLVETPIVSLQHTGTHLEALVLSNGKQIPRQVLYVGPRFPIQRSASIGESLGCQLSEWGNYVVDAVGKTTVPGVYAAGDIAGMHGQSVLFSAASGSRAAAQISAELLTEAAGLTTS